MATSKQSLHLWKPQQLQAGAGGPGAQHSHGSTLGFPACLALSALHPSWSQTLTGPKSLGLALLPYAVPTPTLWQEHPWLRVGVCRAFPHQPCAATATVLLGLTPEGPRETS